VRTWVPALALATAVAACHGGQTPRPDLPDAASLIPIAPAPQPSATPTPAPPSEDPLPGIPGTGGDGGGDSGTCGAPVPPPVSRFAVKIYSGGGDHVTLDSTPLVGPDAAYCRAIGYTDGRSFCPVRPDGHPERLACEAARVGRAADTGRVGPTWTANGQPCTGPKPGASCANHGSNQFFVYAYGSGTFRACAQSGVCGALTLQ
jgi:hypothetical protein